MRDLLSAIGIVASTKSISDVNPWNKQYFGQIGRALDQLEGNLTILDMTTACLGELSKNVR